MTQPGAETAPTQTEFPAHTPSNDTEAALTTLQERTDGWGQELLKRLVFDVAGDVSLSQGLAEATHDAGKLLETTPLDYYDGGFFARYIYAAPGEEKIFPKLVYPADSSYHSAYIIGEVNGVKPTVVEHPAMDRKGPMGYRLCAEVNARRVMGWGGEARKFYIPVGEILLEEIPFEQSMAECLEPVRAR